MGIGVSIFLIAAGAILLFGLNVPSPEWVNLDMVGWILIAAGVIGLFATLALWSRARTVIREDRTIDDPRTLPR